MQHNKHFFPVNPQGVSYSEKAAFAVTEKFLNAKHVVGSLSAESHVTSRRAKKRWKARQHVFTCDTGLMTQCGL